MKPIEVTVPRLIKGIDAITLWPFILYRRGYQDDIPLRCHERYHWRQALRWGVVPWYLVYLVLKPFYLRKPPDQHPLEAPAYAQQRKIRALLDAGENIDVYLTELGMI
jgi:hypothetical protein